MRLLSTLLAAAAAVAPLSVASTGTVASSAVVEGEPVRPNIVVITTDDQSLADLAFMPATRQLLGSQGVTFRGLSPHPLCCPARAEILTGQYAQNNGVYSNGGPNGGYQSLDTSWTLATWLHDAGYQTAFFGKFLNGYSRDDVDGLLTGEDEIPPGWDKWHPTVDGIYDYNDFTVLGDHGLLVDHVDDYQTDVFADLSVDTIRSMAAPQIDGTAHKPFFLWTSFVAPHVACQPEYGPRCWRAPPAADRHAGLFADEVPPSFSDPAFNEADVSDKSSFVRALPLFTARQRDGIANLHRMRLRALQSVDEAVGRMVRTLKTSGELDNTLVVFTSDNGYLLGEHRIKGKNEPFEPALQVPFLMRGPGVPQGVTVPKLATTIDIAPTVAAAAGVDPGVNANGQGVDGRNLLRVANGGSSWSTLLIQGSANASYEDTTPWYFRGVRTARYTFVRYPLTGERELYDRSRDPSQLTNVFRDARYADVRDALLARFAALKDCSGSTCRRNFGPLPGLRPAG